MNQIEQQVECTSCQWNKYCIEPPIMTKEEYEEMINKEKDKAKMDGESGVYSSLLTALVFGGKDKTCNACPVFIDRLSQGPELSNKIKEIMRSI